MPIQIGDFVEATYVGDENIKRQGLLTEVHPDGKVTVAMSTFATLCINPKKIHESGLSWAQQSWLITKRKELAKEQTAVAEKIK